MHFHLIIALAAAVGSIGAVPFALAAPYPFYDDMENVASGNWTLDPPWNYDATAAHSGTRSLSDSPGMYYQNNLNISATLASNLNLSAAQMPVLSFWQRYALEPNQDFGYVDVSTDGGSSWETIYFVTGSSGWRQEKVDLSPYAGTSTRVRFRLQTDAQNVYDGWYIDDVCIQETSNPTIAYPFFDDMEDTAATNANWLSSSWELVTSTPCSPTRVWTDSPEGIPPYWGASSALTLAGTIDLAGAANPQMTFSHHYEFGGNLRWYVDVSTNEGHTWTNVKSGTGSQTSCVPLQVDLSSYTGLKIRVRFRSGGTYFGDGWYVDDVRIWGGPGAVVDWCNLNSPGSITTSAGIVTEPIYGLVFEPGITNSAGQGDGITVQLGYGPDDSLPSEQSWTWVSAAYSADVDSMDRYVGTLLVPHEGTLDYAYRYSLTGSGLWIYGDLDGNDLGRGGSNGYSPSQAGNLSVTGEARISVSPGEFSIALNTGQVIADTLTIRNLGTGALTYQILEAIGGEPMAATSSPISINAMEVTSAGIPGGRFSFSKGLGRESPIPLAAASSGSSDFSAVDVGWVSEIPTSGTIAPGESTMVRVNFDAGALADGIYHAYLVVMNNDLDSDMVVVELHLSVNPPGPFSLVAPQNGTSISQPATLRWRTAVDPDAGDTVRYDVWLSRVPQFSDSLIKVVGLFDSTYAVDDLAPDMNWYWKVKAHDQHGAERWSNETWSFTMVSSCNCPHQGDINGDGFMNVLDVVAVINRVFKGAAAVKDPLCPKERANFNADGATNVLDVVGEINRVFKGGPLPVNPCL